MCLNYVKGPCSWARVKDQCQVGKGQRSNVKLTLQHNSMEKSGVHTMESLCELTDSKV